MNGQRKKEAPLIRPTAPVLVGMTLVTLAGGIGLLFVGTAGQYEIPAFFLLSLFAASLTVGFLGATGVFRTRRTQLGGSAAVAAVLFSLLMYYRPAHAITEVKGTVYLDDRIVPRATVTMLESDRIDSVREINPQDNGQFRFPVTETRKAYKFRIKLPDLDEVVVPQAAKEGWMEIKLNSKELKPHPVPNQALERCVPEQGLCTLLVFDYLHGTLPADALNAFHNFQTQALDKGLRNYLEERNLLGGIDFQVKRCSAVPVEQSADARSVAQSLKVPAVAWGYIQKKNDKLVFGTTFTLADPRPIDVSVSDELEDDVKVLTAFPRPIQDAHRALAMLILGDAYTQKGDKVLANRAFLDAKEVAQRMQPQDRDLLNAIEARLKQVQPAAVVLKPLSGGQG